MKGLNNSRAIFLGSPHWWNFSSGPTTITERPSSPRACPAGSGGTALLPLEHVGEGLEVGCSAPSAPARGARCRRGRPPPPAASASRSGYDVGGAKSIKRLSRLFRLITRRVEVVQIRRGEAAPVQRHQRPQLRRQDRHHLQHHPLRLVAGVQEGLDILSRLVISSGSAGRLLLHPFPQLVGVLLDFDILSSPGCSAPSRRGRPR